MLDHRLTKLLPTLPTLPGCYRYISKDGVILYVGKAKNLRNRVRSYFQNYDELTFRIQLMIDQAYYLEYDVVDSEVEALILESNLIKKYKPKYNVLLKDDKSYSWIKITKDPYPIILRTRSIPDKSAYFFGPFTSALIRDQIYDYLRKQFPFRSCFYQISDEELSDRKKRRQNGERIKSRLCTYYHIHRCGGACEGMVSNEEYNENIESIKKFLKNKKKVLIKEIEQKMLYYSKNEEYKKAAHAKEQLESLQYLSQSMMIGRGDDEDDVRRLSYQRSMKGLELLIKRLKINDLKNFTKEEKADYLENFRIECYDISNIQGTNPVGSMTVNIGSQMEKSHYRKFKINVKDTPDDFTMMREMLTRRFHYLKPVNEIEGLDEHNKVISEKLKDTRYKLQVQSKYAKTSEISSNFITEGGTIRQVPKGSLGTQGSHQPGAQGDRIKSAQDESFSSIPDLIIIDGGKGQLGVAVEALHDLKLDGLFVCGLAKKREEVFVPNIKKSYLFDDKKESLFLLQRIRDETHRFGITFHRQRRSKAMFGNNTSN